MSTDSRILESGFLADTLEDRKSIVLENGRNIFARNWQYYSYLQTYLTDIELMRIGVLYSYFCIHFSYKTRRQLSTKGKLFHLNQILQKFDCTVEI